MGETIDIPDAKALLCVEPHRRFIGLVVLVALRAGADQIRFESRPSEWCISAGRSDGSWEEMQPVSRQAAVDCTLRSLTRAARFGRVLDLLWVKKLGPAEFDLQLAHASTVQCTVMKRGEGFNLTLRQSDFSSEKAATLLKEYLSLCARIEEGIANASRNVLRKYVDRHE